MSAPCLRVPYKGVRIAGRRYLLRAFMLAYGVFSGRDVPSFASAMTLVTLVTLVTVTSVKLALVGKC